MPPTPTPRFKRDWVGFFFWSSVPPLLPRPQTRVGGGFLLSFLPPPTPPSAVHRALRQRPWPACRVNAPGLHTASTPWPVHRINTPGLCAASMPPACALCQRPRAVSTPPACALHQPLPPFPSTPCLCIDTPAWCAVSMPSPVQEEGLLPGFSPSPPLALDKL